MNYNINKLRWELDQAKIPYDWVSEGRLIDQVHGEEKPAGYIHFLEDATQAQKDQAEAIKAAHDPYWCIESRKNEYPPTGDQLDGLYKGMKKLLIFLKSKYPDATDQDILDGAIEEFIDPIEQTKSKYPKR